MPAKPDLNQAQLVLRQLLFAWDAKDGAKFLILDPMEESGQREMTVEDWIAAVEPKVQDLITAAENFIPHRVV